MKTPNNSNNKREGLMSQQAIDSFNIKWQVNFKTIVTVIMGLILTASIRVLPRVSLKYGQRLYHPHPPTQTQHRGDPQR